jgi:hypothetical protein
MRAGGAAVAAGRGQHRPTVTTSPRPGVVADSFFKRTGFLEMENRLSLTSVEEGYHVQSPVSAIPKINTEENR